MKQHGVLSCVALLCWSASASAFDYNGDAYADVLVGATEGGGYGFATIFTGGPGALTYHHTVAQGVYPGYYYATFGASFVSAHLEGVSSGRPDLVIGAPGMEWPCSDGDWTVCRSGDFELYADGQIATFQGMIANKADYGGVIFHREGFAAALAAVAVRGSALPWLAIGNPGDKTDGSGNTAAGSVGSVRVTKVLAPSSQVLLRRSDFAPLVLGTSFGVAIVDGNFDVGPLSPSPRDVAVGAPGPVSGRGAVHIYRGNVVGFGPPLSPSFTLLPQYAPGGAGAGLCSLGCGWGSVLARADVNEDGSRT